jgi:hypothetical protein
MLAECARHLRLAIVKRPKGWTRYWKTVADYRHAVGTLGPLFVRHRGKVLLGGVLSRRAVGGIPAAVLEVRQNGIAIQEDPRLLAHLVRGVSLVVPIVVLLVPFVFPERLSSARRRPWVGPWAHILGLSSPAPGVLAIEIAVQSKIEFRFRSDRAFAESIAMIEGLGHDVPAVERRHGS